MLYHKIKTVFKRDPDNQYKTLLEGDYALSEFEYLAENEWVFTEKIDGTNIRVIWDGERVTFGGKSGNAQIPAHLGNALQAAFPADILHPVFPDGPAVLYGEGYGAKIQKGGGNYRPDQGFILFDVYCGEMWLERQNVNDIAMKLDIPHVPVVGIGTLQAAVNKVQIGFDSVYGDFRAEGLVMRPATELLTRRGHRVITKIKYKDFPR